MPFPSTNGRPGSGLRAAPALRSPWLAALPPLLALLFASALWLSLEPARVMALVAEGSFIERPTELLYFALAALMWFWRQPEDGVLEWAALSLLFVAFGAREMDLHRAWTHDSMLKVSFYLREAPLLHKLVSGAVLLAVVAAALFLMRRCARRIWQGLRRREVLASTVAIFLVTMVVSKVFDRAINILADDYAISTSLTIKALVSVVEELLELSLPLVAAVGLHQHRQARRRRPAA